MKKHMLMSALALVAAETFGGAAVDAMTQDATVVMTTLSTRQRYPWNGKVDIDFSFTSSIPEAFAFIEFKASYENAQGETVNVPMKTFDQFTTAFCTNAGTYRVTWNSTADAPNLQVTNLKYTVTANMAKYMVVDISKGTAATADDPYPITYMEECPDPTRDDGGWTDEYRTTKMVFRLVQPGTYRKGWGMNFYSWWDYQDHEATITRPYYLAIFEVTQGQAKLLRGSYPSTYGFDFVAAAYRDVRPVAFGLSHNAWRGKPSEDGICWPNTGSRVSPTSLIGLLRARTGNNEGFDLPTETEWEYAARAGVTDAWGGDGLKLTQRPSDDPSGPTSGNENTLLTTRARYKYNDAYIKNADGSLSAPDYNTCDLEHGTAKVGSYKPNAWGFYDMLGNAGEATLDYFPAANMPAAATVDDMGPAVPDPTVDNYVRAVRGGSWQGAAKDCSLVTRPQAATYVSSENAQGARLCWHFPYPAKTE